VREKILLRTFVVRLQGIIKNLLEVGRCGSRVSLRHKREVRDERRTVESWVMGKEKGEGDTPVAACLEDQMGKDCPFWACHKPANDDAWPSLHLHSDSKFFWSILSQVGLVQQPSGTWLILG
jgi:hypothetical protein